jgi:hypothetical protein
MQAGRAAARGETCVLATVGVTAALSFFGQQGHYLAPKDFKCLLISVMTELKSGVGFARAPMIG